MISRKHGTDWKRSVDVNCDSDGSFSSTDCDGKQCRCVDKYRTSLGNGQWQMDDNPDKHSDNTCG